MTVYLIDLFCGAGGFSTGAVKCGTKVILAIDIWDTALETHKLNHPDCQHLNYHLGGNKQKTIEMIYHYIHHFIPKLKKNDKIHIHGSPPCQNLSTANNYESKDQEKGLKLTFWTIDLFIKMEKLGIIDSWTIEQVNNVAFRKKLDKVRNIFYKIFNMEEYNVPQTRSRVIVSNISLDNVKKKKPTLVKFDENIKYVENAMCKNYTMYRSITEPFYTIVSSSHYLCDKNKNRIKTISPQEMSLVQTFPKKYQFYYKTILDYKKQIANSVPPNFAKQLLESIT